MSLTRPPWLSELNRKMPRVISEEREKHFPSAAYSPPSPRPPRARAAIDDRPPSSLSSLVTLSTSFGPAFRGMPSVRVREGREKEEQEWRKRDSVDLRRMKSSAGSGRINIAASARRHDVDNRISLRYYYRIADNILKQVWVSFSCFCLQDIWILLEFFTIVICQILVGYVPCSKSFMFCQVEFDLLSFVNWASSIHAMGMFCNLVDPAKG